VRTDGVSTLGGVAVGVAAGTDASLGEDIAGGIKREGLGGLADDLAGLDAV